MIVLPDLRTVYIGRERLEIARECGLKTIPAIVEDCQDVVRAYFDEKFTSKDFSPSVRAWFVFELNEKVVMERLAAGNDYRSAEIPHFPSIRELAKKYGVSAKFLSHLGKLKKEVSKADWASARELVLGEGEGDGEGGCGIMAIKAALAGQRKTTGETPKFVVLGYDEDDEEVSGVPGRIGQGLAGHRVVGGSA